MSLIEKVARALCMHDGRNPVANMRAVWKEYIGSARAAIEAMREPTNNVTNAGWDAMVRANEDRVDGRELVIWQAMIDETLK